MRIILGMIWRIILTFKVERRGEGEGDEKELSAAQSTPPLGLLFLERHVALCDRPIIISFGEISRTAKRFVLSPSCPAYEEMDTYPSAS